MVRVDNLDASIAFYTALFDAEPTKRKPDYAKWMLEDPRLNFAIAARGGDLGIEHLGLQADTLDELEELRARIGRAGGTVRNEGETTCCYAHSDKTWVVDQQGVAWEAFYTSGDADTYYAPVAAAQSACCNEACC
ncbi:MAG: ArsI/CadI family heavy metal resistance metalloenzyme [Bacteroidota bacterium]